jgi:hypothetical protein
MQNEMTINEIKAMYFDDKALVLPPVPLYRYHYKGDRFYYYIDPEELAYHQSAAPAGVTLKPTVHFAVGITTLTRKTIPQPEQLTKWQAEKGWDEAMAYRDERAMYGSLLHTCIATLLIKRVFNLDLMAEVVHNYCKANSLTVNESAWSDDLKQDVLAFAQFAKDYNVRPLAIELSLVSARLGVAGTNDLLCELDLSETGYFGEVYKSGENKGQPKQTKRTTRALAIVDFKSGRSANGSIHNAAQLRLLQMLLKDNYPQFSTTKMKLYNWHPKDWRTAPSYTLVDQTDAFSEKAAMNIIGVYKELYPAVEEKETIEMFGTVCLDPTDEPQANYTSTAIKALVQKAIDENTYGQTKYDVADTYFDENTAE